MSHRKYRAANKHKAAAYRVRTRDQKFDRWLRRKYGITLAERNAMIADQCGLCAICAAPLDLQSRRTHVDHDHNTGRVRGVLCHDCNTGLGMFKDSIASLEFALAYLRRTA